MNKINLIIRSNPEIVIEINEDKEPIVLSVPETIGDVPKRAGKKKLGGRKPKLESDELKEIKSKILIMIHSARLDVITTCRCPRFITSKTNAERW